MRLLKRTLFWIFFLFLLETLLVACDCPEESSFRYVNERLTAFNLDNSAVQAQLSGLDSVNKNAYGIRMNIERTLIAAVRDNWSFGNSAYAMSRECVTGAYHPAITIETIRIVTLHDFDAAHPAGSDITAYFKNNNSGKFYDIENLYNKEAQVIYDNSLPPFEADVLLIEVPEHTGIHAFVVEVLLSDGTLLSDTTSVQLY